MWSAQYFCTIITKSGVSQQGFTNVPKVKFHGNPSCWGNTNACGQTSRKTVKNEKKRGKQEEYLILKNKEET
jgi:hypothetical protein